MSSGMDSREWLRCTAFEELMLDQDSPDYPCVICVRLDLAGNLDLARLVQAFEQVVCFHAMLRCRLERRLYKLWWRIIEPEQVDAQSAIHVHSSPAPAWPTAVYFDLRTEFGWRIDLYPSTGSAVLFLQIHHALADGLGCLQIVEDLMSAYGGSTAWGKSLQKSVNAQNSLPWRNNFGLNFTKTIQLIPKQLVGLSGVRQFVFRQPATLSNGYRPERTSSQIAALHFRCDAQQVELLRQLARQQSVTLNDWLASLVFQACDSYRRTQSGYHDRQWLRMMVPMSLREPSANEQLTTACNVVSCVFLDRSGQQIRGEGGLLESIHAEMNLIKRNRLAFLFVLSIWLKKVFRWRWTPGVVAAPPRRCQTSFVFSNMGRLFEDASTEQDSVGRLMAGGIVLESCEVLAPVAPLMNAAFTTFQYAGQLTVSLRYDARAIDRSQAEQMIHDLRQRMLRTIEEPVGK